MAADAQNKELLNVCHFNLRDLKMIRILSAHSPIHPVILYEYIMESQFDQNLREANAARAEGRRSSVRMSQLNRRILKLNFELNIRKLSIKNVPDDE